MKVFFDDTASYIRTCIIHFKDFVDIIWILERNIQRYFKVITELILFQPIAANFYI